MARYLRFIPVKEDRRDSILVFYSRTRRSLVEPDEDHLPGALTVTRLVTRLRRRILTANLLNHTAVREAKSDKSGGYPPAESNRAHLSEAIDWLARAQDAMPYGGLSRGYSFGWNPYFPKKSWQPPHPKSTALAVATLFDSAQILSQSDLRRRAIDLAHWLVKIQMYSGAIRGGSLDEPPSPEVLNTALAVAGWTRAFRETGAELFAAAIRRGCDFLLAAHELELRPSDLPFSGRQDALTCSTVGLSLIQAGILLEKYEYCAAGEKKVRQALRYQRNNGWFQGGNWDDSECPLLQDTASLADHLLESALILDNKKYLQAARKTADHLLDRVLESGALSGRFDDNWSGRVPWSCLAGNGRMARIFSKLYDVTTEYIYLHQSQRIIDFLKSTQNRFTSHPGLRGGIKGSFPCDSEFGRYQTLSSATLCFVDALLQRPAKVAAPQNLSQAICSSPRS